MNEVSARRCGISGQRDGPHPTHGGGCPYRSKLGKVWAEVPLASSLKHASSMAPVTMAEVQAHASGMQLPRRTARTAPEFRWSPKSGSSLSASFTFAKRTSRTCTLFRFSCPERLPENASESQKPLYYKRLVFVIYDDTLNSKMYCTVGMKLPSDQT